ncbi:nucleotide sugar dehydrogenase [Paenibacillus curdlanolyticus YK9]|uniref:Nucleotide sugar dehydrogenase n=1 Tax=Paenibacillus curdlanolyticus YK9 TaxID=717606 RepID=E0IAL0_9BACL|nr:nucleotide sugar dehydrogenase [Paenibacillus curdlanolyticus]EFM10414.1 nucleotide sugar dehydrogenase [Paenibacillus curdlanolyticus YK9]
MLDEAKAGDYEPSDIGVIGVIGLGYVGLPFAMAFVRRGFAVIGIDVDARKLEMLQRGKSYIRDVEDAELAEAVTAGKLVVSSSFSRLADASSIVICVPTPLTANQAPDLSFLTAACRQLQPHLSFGQLVIVESTTFPGTTREVVQPLLELGGLRAGESFHLAYSPERIDPGNTATPVEDVPKVVSGLTAPCLTRIVSLYSAVFHQVVPVSSTDTAEAAKLLENSFRLVNISFINEFAKLCDQLGLDIWEVIRAASTKPYGFMSFLPGPGIGGHCIPVDPLYMQWKAREAGTESRFIELSRDTNESIPSYIVSRLERLLQPERTLNGASILICGVTYKRDVADLRESSALVVMERLCNAGATVAYYDPYIPTVRIGEASWRSISLTDEAIAAADCILIHTDHAGLPIDRIVAHAAAIYDTRNLTRGKSGPGKLARFGDGSRQ